MGLAGYDPNRGQWLKTGSDKHVDRSFIAHYQIAAADAVAEGAATVLAATPLTAAVQTFDADNVLAQPAVPRCLSITCDTAGCVGNVLITGLDSDGVAMSDTIALNGAKTVAGDEAFASITGITFPVARYQSGGITVTAGASAAADMTITVTAAALTGSSEVLTVGVLNGDTAEQVAGKIVDVANLNPDITGDFTFTADGADVIMTAKAFAAQDATYNIAFSGAGANGTGVTLGAYAGIVSGNPAGNVSIGTTDDLGLPHCLPYDTILKIVSGGIADTVATSSFHPTTLGSNWVNPTVALNGSQIDIYYLV
ncbi:MAG TPA: hypothetical protein PKO23_17220 [Candidatus Hydrogenedentes bacterium]|nr:hypothetical protein [Candidatus Hydrogenedentota bacterium]